MPTAQECSPDDSDVPECQTGPTGRMRFVVSELRDVWRELLAHGKPQSGDVTPQSEGPESGDQERE
ncbi:hypothetical protein BKA03_001437 [Demequina lutea]|uniref:Uncharacterized protein n=1 Tax=Demequina lutea TaxID=431489 RepID=A0A7Y9ZBW9_9MICO|nr:hypothetical protein [Demequina lutea]